LDPNAVRKTRVVRSVEDRVVANVLSMGLSQLTITAGKLIEADIETAKYLADKILASIEEVNE